MPAPLHVVARGDTEIVFARGFAAPRGDVFDAMTRPEYVRRWLTGPPGWTMTECTVDFRVGGTFRYAWSHDDGREMAMSGNYRTIERPARVVHSERFEFGCEAQAGEQVATLELSDAPDGAGTSMRLVVVYPSKEARDGALESGAAGGLEHGYGRLDGILAGGSDDGDDGSA